MDDLIHSLKLIQIEKESILHRSESLDSSSTEYTSSDTTLSSREAISFLNETPFFKFPANEFPTTESQQKTCVHRIIEDSGYFFCDFCGKEFTGNISYEKTWDPTYASARVQRVNVEEGVKVNFFSIKEDLKFMGLNEDILVNSFESYKKVTENGTKIHRSKLRKSILCACVKYVFDIRQIPCDENDLIRQFEIDKKDYSKGFKQLKMKVPETRSCQDDVLISLRNLFRKLDIDKQFFKTIECIYKTVKHTTLIKTNETFDEGPVFKDKNAKTIAAIVIYYWLENQQLNVIDINNFSVECLIPKYSLHKAYKECCPLISQIISFPLI